MKKIETTKRARKGSAPAPANASRRAAHVLAFLDHPDTPEVIKTAALVFLTHADSAMGIDLVSERGGAKVNPARLAKFIERAERDRLGYDEGGLFDDKTGAYLVQSGAAESHEQHRRTGEFLARILAHPDVSAVTHNIIQATLDEMVSEAGMSISQPDMLRAAFPLVAAKLSPDYFWGLRNALFSALDYGDDSALVEELRADVHDGRRKQGQTSPTDDADEQERARRAAAVAAMPRADLAFKGMDFKTARRIAMSLSRQGWDEEVLGDVLALVFGLAYCETSARESIAYEVMHAFMSGIESASDAAETFAIGRLRADRTEDVEALT